jgi:aminoglycoside 6'-N-acetyltransferase
MEADEVVTVLEGEVVVLHAIADTDVEALLDMWSGDPGVVERWPRWTRAEIENILDGAEGERGWWITVDGERVGYIQQYEEIDYEYRHAGIDLFLVAAARGRGAGTDAVRTVVRHLVDDLGHHRVVIDPAADNAAAIRTYEKVGFRPVGVMREYELGGDGTWHDNLLMDLLARDLA